MSAYANPLHTRRNSDRSVPPLHPGDRLTRLEFERRYDSTPNPCKAELIEGVVYMSPPPVSQDEHSSPHFRLIWWLGMYWARTPGVEGGDNGSLRLDLDNMPQPDAFLRILESHGGQSQIDSDGFIAGAPEFVAEVAATSASYDLHAKLNVYRRHGVREYLVWRTFDRQIDYFAAREGRFDRVEPGARGIIKSNIFPGLWLDPAAMIAGTPNKIQSVLTAGLASATHRAFVAKLKKVGRKSN